jgi:hypothetical protein
MKECVVKTSSQQSDVKQSIAELKKAYDKGELKKHQSHELVAAKGCEVLTSWGSAMRR